MCTQKDHSTRKDHMRHALQENVLCAVGGRPRHAADMPSGERVPGKRVPARRAAQETRRSRKSKARLEEGRQGRVVWLGRETCLRRGAGPLVRMPTGQVRMPIEPTWKRASSPVALREAATGPAVGTGPARASCSGAGRPQEQGNLNARETSTPRRHQR
jgi:hypothetical protein